LSEQLTIDRRFCGFPEAALGGYVLGLMVDALNASDADGWLRAPVPLGTPLELAVVDGKALLRDEDNVLAEAAAAELDLEAPEAVGVERAEEASKSFPGFDSHLYPGCFGCGTDPDEGEGLRLFPGELGGGAMAAPWTPPPELVDGESEVPRELVWSAFDCPQLWSLMRWDDTADDEAWVTGQMSARIDRPVRVGEPHVVLSWPINREGRKLFAGAAIYDADEKLCALSRQTAIIVPGMGDSLTKV
jgi:hypothetical protein